MSDKARRSNAWDDKHLRGPLLWPVKAVLRAFSSITLAVCLLLFVCVFAISASVPVGMLLQIPSLLVVALTFVLALTLGAAMPAWMSRHLVSKDRRAARFVLGFVSFLVLAPLVSWLWARHAWPALHYDPVERTGLRFFAESVERYRSTTIRRLPGVEMSELEFYAWWPLRVVLLMFVVNMVVATVRRIEFTFKNLGVLTVHTGIVVIALGSIYYGGLKMEGDTVLLAGELDGTTGTPRLGQTQDAFYDNTKVALYVRQGIEWEQRLLEGVPRYNDYGLSEVEGQSAWKAAGRKQPWDVPSHVLDRSVMNGRTGLVDDDIAFRVVGYAQYAEGVRDYVREDLSRRSAVGQELDAPLRLVYLHSGLPDEQGVVSDDPAFAFVMLPRSPKDRVSSTKDEDGKPVLSVEYTIGMSEERWRDLSEAHAGSLSGLSLRVGTKRAYLNGVQDASTTIAGYSVTIRNLLREPPFPIITPGFEGATCATAEVRVRTPEGEEYTRYVYSRYPELDQDVFDTPREDGRPNRRAADKAIAISLVESDHLAVYIDEQVAGGIPRGIVRTRGGAVRVSERLTGEEGALWLREVVDRISLRVGERWESAIAVDRPSPVPELDRKKDDIGTHRRAMLGLEVSIPKAGDGKPWRQVVWLPFQQYMGMGGDGLRRVRLPDGRSVTLAFGRLQHRLPGFVLQLASFDMLSYDHRGAPRDYQSRVRVSPVDDGSRRFGAFEAYEHVTQLNAPLTAPFHWSERRTWLGNLARRLLAGLSPFQFKFSQAGWDQQGWNQSQQQVDAGIIPRPFAKFTILGVGNNPGIHVVALGSILMGVGIPWAFYIKPWLVQREKRTLAALAAARKSVEGAS